MNANALQIAGEEGAREKSQQGSLYFIRNVADFPYSGQPKPPQRKPLAKNASWIFIILLSTTQHRHTNDSSFFSSHLFRLLHYLSTFTLFPSKRHRFALLLSRPTSRPLLFLCRVGRRSATHAGEMKKRYRRFWTTTHDVQLPPLPLAFGIRKEPFAFCAISSTSLGLWREEFTGQWMISLLFGKSRKMSKTSRHICTFYNHPLVFFRCVLKRE